MLSGIGNIQKNLTGEGTLQMPKITCPVSTDPLVENVKLGTTYKINDVDLVGTLDVVTPPSGIQYQRVPTLFANLGVSYYNYDEHWHLINGSYDYTPPSNPATIARLDLDAVDPFSTLVENNAFGNKNRFTDKNGLQVYSDQYKIDHLTGLGWFMGQAIDGTWETSLDWVANGTWALFSDWRVCNLGEALSVAKFNVPLINGSVFGDFFNSPINIDRIMTCVTTTYSTTQYFYIEHNSGRILGTSKTTSNPAGICRNHYT